MHSLENIQIGQVLTIYDNVTTTLNFVDFVDGETAKLIKADRQMSQPSASASVQPIIIERWVYRLRSGE